MAERGVRTSKRLTLWVTVLACSFLIAFAAGIALFLLGSDGSLLQRIGAGLVFASVAIVVTVALLANVLSFFAEPGRFRVKTPRDVIGLGAPLFLLLGGIELMFTLVLASIGFGDATIHDSGPGLDAFVRTGMVLISLSLILWPTVPAWLMDVFRKRWEALGGRAAEWTLWLAFSRPGGVIVSLLGLYVAWRTLAG